MKKLTLILVLTLFAISSYAQEPTKQETIDWILEKLVKCKGTPSYYSSSKYSNSENIYTWSYKFNNVAYDKETSTIRYYCDNDHGRVFDGYDTNNTGGVLKLDFSKVFQVDIKETEGIKSLEIKGENIYSFYRATRPYEPLKNTYVEYSTLILNANAYKSDDPKNYFTQYLIDFGAEPDLFNRMAKAFQTLVKYNNTNRPKEKF